MKKIISILLGICLCGGVFAQTQLKIISFNIHAGYDAPIADIAAFIKEQDPDIVALQEVEYYTNRTGANTPRSINNNINMLNELAYLTGMHGMFYVTLEKCYGGKFGNAILSKHSFDETRRIMLPCAAGTEQRNAAIADIKLPDGTEFSIVDTHIDMSKLDNGMSQIKEVNRSQRRKERGIGRLCNRCSWRHRFQKRHKVIRCHIESPTFILIGSKSQ